MKNLEILKDLVDVKYNDMNGLFAFDENDSDNIHSLCQSQGIDTDKHFVLGFGFEFGEIRGDERLEVVTCKILLLDEEYGISYDEVLKNAASMPSLKAVIKRFDIPVTELGRYIKRFDAMALTEIGNHIRNIEIVEE